MTTSIEITLRKIDEIPGNCCVRGELRRALGLGYRDVLELPEPNTRSTNNEEAWTKGLIRRWLRGELPVVPSRTTERTAR